MDTETTNSTDLSRTLREGLDGSPAWQRYLKWALLAIVILAAAYFTFGRDGAKATTYTTQEVVKGDLTVTVTATGNLEPRNQVEIGSELSGIVDNVNVDVNTEVKAGQVLAKLNTTRLKAQVLQAESSLASAEARVLQADAGAKEARANFARLQKVRELSGNKLPSQQDGPRRMDMRFPATPFRSTTDHISPFSCRSLSVLLVVSRSMIFNAM